MELSGIPRDSFPLVGNDSKTLRKLSLLEARMVGNESRDASLPPNDGSRGSENNSNSMCTIGFAKPRPTIGSPVDVGAQPSPPRGLVGGGAGNSRTGTKGDEKKEGPGKRKGSQEVGFSPPRPASHVQSAGTPSTLSTSPGESRDWVSARPPAQGGRDDVSSLKRARTGSGQQPTPLPPPPRFHLPHGESGRPMSSGPAGGTGVSMTKGGPGHNRRGLRGAESGGVSPAAVQASGRTGFRQPFDRPDPSVASGVAHPPPAPTFSVAEGAELSPPSGGRGVKSGGHVMHPGTTKTIKSYFSKPSNSSAVQNLAASYGAGDPLGQTQSVSSLPKEVDLSSSDIDASHIEASHSLLAAREGRSNSTGGSTGGGGGEGVSLQRRFAHGASPAADSHVGQAYQGQRQAQGHAHALGLASVGAGTLPGRDNVEGDKTHKDVEKLAVKLREAEALAGRLRKELDRAHLERGSMESMADTLQKQLDRKIEEYTAKDVEREAQKEQLTSVVEALLRKVSAQEAIDCRAKLARNMLELGKIVSVKTGHIGKYVEAFEEGSSFKDVESKTVDVLSRKTKLEARKRAVSKLLKVVVVASAAGDEISDGQARLEAIEEEETVRMHLAAVRREEVALQEEKRALDARKVLHIRELKRVAHEDRSKFSKRPTLSGRYVLLNLLGKGGFSEVWRAFDLVHAEDVAVKVHQLLNNWSEAQKTNFIRHVTREYEIHQQMTHPRIVKLTDVFEICCDSFATVLDYCRGTDLECLLRERKQLPERDARALVLQVARGLQYLNTAQGEGVNGRGAIIHYDLKPGNILLDEHGDVKITDFGLSKILEIKKDTERGLSGGTSMELTSKGAGTYWYLPPECFGDNSRISSKVDVWSLGVVFYQMLYGVRPFGEGLSQEKILREKVIVNANRVDFPSKPAVSEEAKSFIRSCLTYTHATRPDVHAMCDLPYLTTPAAKRGA